MATGISNGAVAMPLVEHLRELRSRLVRSALGVLLGTLSVWNLYPQIFAVIRKPFDEVHELYPTSVLALTGVTSGFSLQLKISLIAGFIIASPIWLYQTWRFIAPGLHRHERLWAYVFTTVAVPFFIGGVTLAYFVLPKMMDVLYTFTPTDVSNVTSVDNYLNFFIHVILFFGVGFLIPLAFIMLNTAGLLSGRTLLSAWRWIILGAFIFGAVATPSGDPLGMTVVAVPLIALTFVAVGIAVLNDKRRLRQSDTLTT